MAPVGIGVLKQAIVKALRDDATLKAATSNEFHEGLSPRDVDYPYVIYDIEWSTRGYNWTSSLMRCGFTVWAVSDDQVEAHNLDALVIGALQDKNLDVGTGGEYTMYLRRISDESIADLDDAGSKFYQVGGTFEAWLSSSL